MLIIMLTSIWSCIKVMTQLINQMCNAVKIDALKNMYLSF